MPDPTALALALADRAPRMILVGGRRHGRTEAMRLASLRVVARAMPGHDAAAPTPSSAARERLDDKVAAIAYLLGAEGSDA